MSLLNTKDLAFAATMTYIVYPLKNGEMNAEELQKRATDIKYMKYNAIKVAASSASRNLVNKVGIKKVSQYGESILCGVLVGGLEYMLMDEREDKELMDYGSMIILHSAAHALVKMTGKVADKKIV